MAKENNNKSFVLRIDAATMDALELWAADEFRSINGQLQWIIADALRRSGRLGPVRQSVCTVLNVRPLLTCREGAVVSCGMVRGHNEQMRALAKDFGVTTLLHLSTLTEQGSFSAQSAGAVLENETARAALIRNTVREMRDGGFVGIDVDFEFLGKALAASYAAFLQELSQAVHTAGGYLMAAVAPKTSDTQPGVLYEGHDYAAIGKAVDQVLLMTYEWGYTYGPPMAVAPIDAVERVVRYAVSRIEPGKLLLGFPNYAYDWTLPYEAGLTRAVVIGNEAARQLAFDTRSEIQFDETAQTPWFSYTGMDGAVHEVWFEDARSSLAKFHLVKQYALRGLGYWNFMRPFTANFSLANAALRLPD